MKVHGLISIVMHFQMVLGIKAVYGYFEPFQNVSFDETYRFNSMYQCQED